MSNPEPFRDVTAADVTFNKTEDAAAVLNFMRTNAQTFAQACDYFEFRPNVHYFVVRTDRGEDGRG